MHTAPWYFYTQKRKGDITMPNIVIAIAIILLAEAAFLGIASCNAAQGVDRQDARDARIH